MSLSQAEQIFHRALELENIQERNTYLDSACAGQAGLRAQVEELLRSVQEAPASFLDTAPENSRPALDPAEEVLGTLIGRYKLLEKIGEGGCGVVYVAEQTEPFRRRVALKVIKLGMDTKAVVARFEGERQALAIMDHPHIAKVFDAGTTENGRPYFVMELVRGIRITEYCDRNKLGLKERLDLFNKVCHGIQHAHQKGIIHRDIKPSNILVTLHDGAPVPKVIDFGIAKATEGRLTEATIYTQLHQFVGTPAYMSPEQAELSGLDIDTRSDIYSLGVLLYELLTGTTPFDAHELMSQGLEAMRRTICEKDPPRPSTRLTQIMAADARSVAFKLAVGNGPAAIPSDLDWIALKCLEKDRTRRYETANGLAADVQRHLTNEPVVARPPSTAYRVQKAWRRHRVAYVAGLAVILALLAGAVVSTLQARRALRAESLAKARLVEVQKERDATEEARQNAEQVSRFLQEVFQRPDPARDGRTVTVAETLERAAKQLESDLATQPERRARLQATLASTYGALGLPIPEMQLREKAHAFWLATRGPDDPETMSVGRDLAFSYIKNGQFEKSLRLSEDMLPRSLKLYGPDHTNTVHVLFNQASALNPLGRNEEAIGTFKTVMAASLKAFGPEHRRTLITLDALSSAYEAAGDYDKALQTQEEVLALSRKIYGEEHPETLRKKSNLGIRYLNKGRYDDTIQLLEPALETCRRVLGREHDVTIHVMDGLASACHLTGRAKEALGLREQLVQLTRKVEGPENYRIGRRLENLAVSYAAAGRLDDALKACAEALAVIRKIFGPAHQETVRCTKLLSGYYQASGDYDSAINFLEEVVRQEQKVFGEQHLEVVSAIKRKADLFAAQGKWVEAKKELLRISEFKQLPAGAHEALMCLAALEAYLGDTLNYETQRRFLLHRFATTDLPEIAERVAKSCLILPLNGDELEAAVTLGEKPLKIAQNHRYRDFFLFTEALAKYRAGDWNGAAQRAETSLKSKAQVHEELFALDYAVLAMARHKANQPEAARSALEQSRAILNEKSPQLDSGTRVVNWHDALFASVLLREAEELLRKAPAEGM